MSSTKTSIVQPRGVDKQQTYLKKAAYLEEVAFLPARRIKDEIRAYYNSRR